MSHDNDPVMSRVQAQLQWPRWQSWVNNELGHSAGPLPPVPTGPVDHESRGAAMRRRLNQAKTVAQGGPYLEVFREAVLERTEREYGTDVGPLASFSFAIKDLLAIEGHQMQAGSAVRSDAPVEQATAPIITQLESLGAVAIGTVTLHEFAFGVTGVNPYAGTAVNPKAPECITGGSSSGSAAAVADGSARISIGTDTGGSIRGPASFCGVVGFKPSFGLYPSAGVFPLSGTLDHVGLFAINMDDIITTHRALGFESNDTQLPGRVGVARAEVEAADADVQELVNAALVALEAAGCEIVDVTLPDAEMTFATSTAIMFPEAAAIHADSLAAHPDRYGDDIKARLALGAALSATQVATAHELRRQLMNQVQSTLATVDVIVGPTTPMTAPLTTSAADPALPPRIVANTRLGNVVGVPALSLPLTTSGPPVGLQVMGLTDASLLGFAHAIETAIIPMA